MGLRPTKLNENGSEWSIFEAAAAALPLWEPEARFRLGVRPQAGASGKSGSVATAVPKGAE